MKMKTAEAMARILKALANPVRIILVEALRSGEKCGCELNGLVAIDQSTLSRHLASLRQAGIVSERRAGVRIYYTLRAPCILQACSCALEAIKTNERRSP